MVPFIVSRPQDSSNYCFAPLRARNDKQEAMSPGHRA